MVLHHHMVFGCGSLRLRHLAGQEIPEEVIPDSLPEENLDRFHWRGRAVCPVRLYPV